MFREEMSAERQPPVGELVEAVVRDGRSARRRRRTWAGVGAAGVAAAVGAVLLVPGGGTGGGPAATPLTGPKPVLAASSTSTAIKQPAGSKSPVTDGAVIEQLARLLPRGRTSGYAGSAPEKGRYAFGQIYLDTGKGPGMVRAFVYKGGLSEEACSTKPDTKGVTGKEQPMLDAAKSEQERAQIRRRFAALAAEAHPGCRDLPGGGRALIHTDTKTGDSSATVDHGNGVVVLVFTTTWLAWNGSINPPGTVALTPDQVLKIAAYPGWGARMDSALVRKAATDYPSLPTVS